MLYYIQTKETIDKHNSIINIASQKQKISNELEYIYVGTYKKVLYPIIKERFGDTYEKITKYISDNPKYKASIFIYGTGYAKVSNIKKVPLFDTSNITHESIQDYLNKYGKYVLFYSLTEAEWKDSSFISSMLSEFKVLLGTGYDYINKFTQDLYRLNELILKGMSDKGIGIWGYSNEIYQINSDLTIQVTDKNLPVIYNKDMFQITLNYRQIIYTLNLPCLDVVSDDSNLMKYINNVYDNPYKTSDTKANINDVLTNPIRLYNIDECTETSMKDNLEIVFSTELKDMYAQMMETYKLLYSDKIKPFILK